LTTCTEAGRRRRPDRAHDGQARTSSATLGLRVHGRSRPGTGRSSGPVSRAEPVSAPGGQGPVAPPPGTLREGSGPRTPGALYIPEQLGNTLLVTEYLGQAVYGPGEQKVGTISNLLVDTTGRVAGVVLDVGGFLGIGTNEVAISFEALFPVREDDQDAFLVEMSKAAV
jgi:hypothetical protein